MTTTTNLGLTNLEIGQSSKETTINDNMLLLDSKVSRCLGVFASDPPVLGLAAGTVYFNNTTMTIKMFINSAWINVGPEYLGDLSADPTGNHAQGSRYYNTTSNSFKTLRGTTWING